MDAALDERVGRAVVELVASGSEVGLQVAVYAGGELVADAAAGLADPASGEPVASATLFYAASSAKGVASSIAHALVEAGEMSYGLEAGEVWPEMAAAGKGGITLRHVLMHTAGLPGLPADLSVEELCDWERMCEVVVAEPLWWEPGQRFGYHALTFGFLLGELVRRATGETLSAQLRRLLTGPLGIEDEVHFGVPESLLDRVARAVPAPAPLPEPSPGSPLARAIPEAVRPGAGYANRRAVLAAEIPAAGTMSARGAARLYAAMLGGIDGLEPVSAARRAEFSATAFEGRDEVMEMDTTWALGYSQFRPAGSRPGSTFGMVGANGSAAYADIDSGVAVAVMRNRFDADPTALTAIDGIVKEET